MAFGAKGRGQQGPIPGAGVDIDIRAEKGSWPPGGKNLHRDQRRYGCTLNKLVQQRFEPGGRVTHRIWGRLARPT